MFSPCSKEFESLLPVSVVSLPPPPHLSTAVSSSPVAEEYPQPISPASSLEEHMAEDFMLPAPLQEPVAVY